MKTLLVTGASGFLGWHLCQIAQGQWQVVGTSYRHRCYRLEVPIVAIDLTDAPALTTLFQEVQPDAVIHTAAQSKPNLCQLEPEAAYAINVTASWHIADLCAEASIPCVFTSSELVFDGLHPPYREDDPVNPVSVYGEQKVLAEQGMLARYPKTAVCRMPLMFGVATPAESFLQPFLQKLRSGTELALFIDEIRTPISARAACHGLLLALEKVQGYLHLGGKERVSRYEFGQLLVEIFNLTTANIKPCRQADVPMPAPRPPDVSMDSSLAYSLGYDPGELRQELIALRQLT